jgi:hypothetical protein
MNDVKKIQALIIENYQKILKAFLNRAAYNNGEYMEEEASACRSYMK